MGVDLQYATMWSWWYSFGDVVGEGAIHELIN